MKFKTHLAIIILMILGSAVLMNQISQPLAIIQSKTDIEQSEDGKTTDSDDAVYVLQSNLAINSFSNIKNGISGKQLFISESHKRSIVGQTTFAIIFILF